MFLSSGEHVLTTGEKKFHQHTVTLMAVGTLECWKKRLKKSYFSSMARPFPPPLLMARPLREELFFAASLK